MSEGIQQLPSEENRERESLFDPFLEDLWNKYNFSGHPPKKGSQAESRFFDKCALYATYLDHPIHYPDEHAKKDSDSMRRQLHNEIAIMIMGQKRSGMKSSQAEHIANFAYEYARGITPDEAEKFKQKDNN